MFRQSILVTRTIVSRPTSSVRSNQLMVRQQDSSAFRFWSSESVVAYRPLTSLTRRNARSSIKMELRFSAMISNRILIQSPPRPRLCSIISASARTDITEDQRNLYSFAPVESTGWTTVIKQPRVIAYKPVHDLLQRMTILAGWLIVGTGIIAWLAGKYYRRQNEATARIEREVIFNDKILANMPSGIALIDPETRHFLQANEAFGQMARRFGNLSPEKEMSEASFDEVGIAPPEAIRKCSRSGPHFNSSSSPWWITRV